MKRYKTVVKGATMTGIAIALCDPENTLIIEQGNQFAEDFYASIRIDPEPMNIPTGRISKDFWDEIKKHDGLIDNGLLAINEMMPTIGSYLGNKGVKVLFDFWMADKLCDDDHIDIKGICRSKMQHIETEYFVDTTDTYAKQNADTICFTYNLIIRKMGDSRIKCPNALLHDFSNGCYVMDMLINENDSFFKIRMQALSLFDRKRTDSMDQLLKAADRICIRGTQKPDLTDSHDMILPSCLSTDMFNALERGEQIWRDRIC